MFLATALKNYFQKHSAQEFVVQVLSGLLLRVSKQPLSILREHNSVVSCKSLDDDFLVDTFTFVCKLVQEGKEFVCLDVHKLYGPQEISCLEVWQESKDKVVFQVGLHFVNSDEELDYLMS